ncbi:bifunctional 2-polyprenyl-6-hydroxyphenol methylase/3-demethylubiquinol 3-O-methyltransferase UbiG [Halobacillus sp. A5]|uniref:class I SAM-dependent methyltransferase n=1 Tax=Halobacillus sp. A5 TaxID=2880263 RepID=UPI0020A6AB94|nr:class I SAM-dependent methyltransferase [Halobacillus sp. A5]MCP3028437.1 class I SAM-dependent methyltransferase [Halobacillus sp. A5]
MKNRKSIKEIHEYWVNTSTPEKYADKLERSEFLSKYVQKYIAKKGSILEAGCNVGRNLNHLYEDGYHRLTGIEISKEAVEALQKTYPEMAAHSNIIHSPIEDVIREMRTNSFHLVFSMAVLEHIHPDSEWVFEELARISRAYLITIEAERAENWRLFPRNYKTIFEQYGFVQVEESNCIEADLKHYTLRVFKKVGK